MSTKLLERITIVEGFPAVDLSAAANTGDWVSLKHYGKCVVVFVSGIGTAGDDPTLTLQQATDVSGSGAKSLTFTELFRKQAATSLAATSAWTKVSQSAANTYTNDTSAEQSLIWAVEVDANQLDVDNGFDCLRATVADVGGNAQPGYLFYILGDARYSAAPTALPSAIG